MASTLRARLARFLRSKTDHRDRIPAAHVAESERVPNLVLVALFVTCAYIAVGLNDRLVDERHDHQVTRTALAKAREDLARYGAVPAVHLEREGYRCRTTAVRVEWDAAVLAKCRELGQLLQTARASR